MKVGKNILSGWVSSIVEAYNMAIFSFAAPFLAGFLFPALNKTEALLYTFSLPLLGTCFCYPLGAFLFGSLGDAKGRQKICIYSTLGLAFSTGILGLLPFSFFESYAWCFFLFLISLQHFFSAGEYSGSIVFSLEHGGNHQRGYMSAMSCLAACFGLILANGFASASIFLDKEIYLRGCFLLGFCGGVLSYYLKRHCQETPVFLSISTKDKLILSPIEFIRIEGVRIFQAFLGMGSFIVCYSFIFIFLPLVPFENQSSFGTFETFIALIFYALAIFIGGIAADKWGLIKTMRGGALIFAVTLPLISLVVEQLLTMQLLLTSSIGLFIGPIHGWLLDLFPPETRCRGLFISTALSMALLLGSTVPLCLFIFEWTGSLLFCGFYPMAFSLASAGVLNWSKERAAIVLSNE